MTFVLLHGGWCWSRLSQRLRRNGHAVYTPTFLGRSDRAHTLNPQVNLSLHIDDVVRLIDAESLTDVVLVGHSYAGMVVSGVAELRPDALKTRVHLDASVPEDGDAAIGLLPDQVAHHYREAGLLHEQVTSDLACPAGRPGRMLLCPSPIRASFVTTSCASRGAASPA